MSTLILDSDVVLYLSLPHENSLDPFGDQNYQNIKQNAMISTFAEKCIACLSEDGGNFRKNKYPTYKAQRNSKERPQGLLDLKEWIINNDPDLQLSMGGEADDAMLVHAARLRNEGKPYSFATIDKDIYTYPGTFYNLRKGEISHVSPRQALDFTFEQMLTGDPIDGIPGLYGVGKVKANKILEQFDNDKDKWHGIKDTWKEKKGNSWEKDFNQDTNLVFIRRHEEDIKPLDFSQMDWEDFRPHLRFHIQDHEELGW